MQSNNTGVFEGLQHNTDYEVVINVTDKAGNSNSITKNARTDELVVGDLTFKKSVSEVEFLPSTTEQEKVWLNEDLSITINQASRGNTTYKVEKNGVDGFEEYAQDGLITVENGDYIITVVTTDGTNTVSKEYYFTVDKTAPEVNTYIVSSLDDVIDSTTIIESTEITESKYIVTVAEDDASGVVAYALNNNSEEEPIYTEFDATSQILEKSDELTKNGIYYVYIKDQAGNSAVKEVKINNIGYTVQYNLNGGTSEEEIQDQVKLQGTNLTLTNIKPSKVGYIFKGWATAQDATEVEYGSNGAYMKDEGATLYAVWSEAVASATVGEDVTYYESVQDAINSAGNNEATVTLIKSEIVESITVVAGQKIILNVNGSTLRNEDGKPTIDNYGTLTIEGDGLLTSDSSTYSTVVNNNGTFTKNGECVIENTGSGADGVYALNNLGTAVLKAGSVVSTQSVAVGNSGTLTLGDSSDEMNSSTPVIIGKIYGISGEATGTINFYDGIVKGQSGEGSAISGTVGTVASGYELYKTVETVDDVVVESARLARVAVFDTGQNVNKKMKVLSGTANASYTTSNSNIYAIKESDIEPDISTMTSNNIVSASTSAVPIYMWYEDNTIYWWSEAERVKLHGLSHDMFYYLKGLTDLTGLESWDTSSVTGMSGMFYGCSSLTDLTGLESWDTSSVTNMSYMFYGCSALSDLTALTSWDTSSVTNMSYMFYNCSTLSDLTALTSWGTSSVNNMSYMFTSCRAITDATGINNWNITNVTNFTYMFRYVTTYPDWNGTWDSNGTFTPGETTESQVSVASSEIGKEVSTTENTSAELMTFAMNEVEETTQTAETADATDGTDTTETTQATPIVQIGTTTYSTISEAIAAANSVETLKLLDNITLTEELVIPENKNINLDLNSKTITSSLINTITNQGTLTITSMGIIRNEIENGSVIYNTGTINMNNGIITSNANGGKGIYNDSGIVNMKAGKVVTEGIGSIAVYNVNKAKMNVEDGIIEVTGFGSKGIYNDSELEMKGGNIVVSGDDSIGIYNLDKATKCTMKDVEILVEAETIENYEQIKNTDEFKQELEQMKSSYGIYNNSTINVEIHTATITVERLKGVGIMNKLAGSITLGIEDEEVNSASPIIYAISDNTTAIINSGKGQINFFDGRLSTLSSIKDVITKVLDNYEIAEEIGESVINSILKLIETDSGDGLKNQTSN